MDERADEFVIPEYAELKEPAPRQSVVQTGISSEGVRSGSVSRSKFDLVKDKLKKVQVRENVAYILRREGREEGTRENGSVRDICERFLSVL